MGVIAYFLPGIILENPPATVGFLHPERPSSLLGIDNVLQPILPGNLEGATRKRGELEVLVEILGLEPSLITRLKQERILIEEPP